MLLRKTLGSTRERVARPYIEDAFQLAIVQQLAHFVMVIEQILADRAQLLPLRHVHTSGNDYLVRTHVEVVAAPGGLLQAVSRPPGGYMAFIGALVRRKPDVAVNPHHALLCRPQVCWSKVLHPLVDAFDDREHRLFEFALEDWLSRLEPFPAGVPLPVGQKLQSLGTKVRQGNRLFGL